MGNGFVKGDGIGHDIIRFVIYAKTSEISGENIVDDNRVIKDTFAQYAINQRGRNGN